jgi:hypothetical protein
LSRLLAQQHLSIRVPWHDTDWSGRVCARPAENLACLRLERIREKRNDEQEVRLAGQAWHELPTDKLPPCVVERAGFMSPRPWSEAKTHAFAEWSPVHAPLGTAQLELPPYAANCIPYLWMLRDGARERDEAWGLGLRWELEEEVDEAMSHEAAWIQHGDNQRIILDTFFEAVVPETSLCFIYAKETPLVDDPRRVLVGVGRVLAVGDAVEFAQLDAPFRSFAWERAISHSIRPDFADGFLMPYQEILALADLDSSIDPAEFAVLAPDESFGEFSFVSEHVSNDTAISCLLSLEKAVSRLIGAVEGPWDNVRDWINARLAELWAMRGPFPGLGPALQAFGLGRGALISFAIANQLEPNEDPWPTVDRLFSDPSSFGPLGEGIGKTQAATWAALPDERRALLQLIARFDLSIEQAKRFYQPTERERAGLLATDAELVRNPYLLFELDRITEDPVPVTVVDRGVFPDPIVRDRHPLPEPSSVDEAIDPRRVRALLIDRLEEAAANGNSLAPMSDAIQAVRDLPLEPACPIGPDSMAVVTPKLGPVVELTEILDGTPALQLDRLAEAAVAIRRTVTKRAAASALSVKADWAAVVTEALRSEKSPDADELLARREKAAALEVLATSRISVLVGPAGTGKTTLLQMLCALPEVEAGGIQLLAPTGKARVQLEQSVGKQALTLAQFLLRLKRYDPLTGRYHTGGGKRFDAARTVIVDECSMLTEDQLLALLDGLERYERLILVGDPRQLPPIGPGRPFVDIVTYLRASSGVGGFPLVGRSYAELTVPRRQVEGAEGQAVSDRSDLLLAQWFGGGDPAPGADEVWDRLARGVDLGTLEARRWDTPDELHDLIIEVLREELGGADPLADEETWFGTSYGGSVYGNSVYYWRGAAAKAEDWQILSPLRGRAVGTTDLNRMIKSRFRDTALRQSTQKWSKTLGPQGPEQIIYGDKVINVRNKVRTDYFPKVDGALEYVANGEIGVVVGQFKGKKSSYKKPWKLEVELSSQLGVSYDFNHREFGENASPPLELAYAVTIHKAQGSEFGLTLIVIPDPCLILSRELIYTALTRQRARAILLHQGELRAMREYAQSTYSETARRLTNVFTKPDPVAIDDRRLEAGLIHRTRKGHAVRSKSEVVIADLLFSMGIDYEYEKELTIGGITRLPDFTIEDFDTGVTYYWEHLGMLHVPSYQERWNRKEAWYRSNGILSVAEGGGPNGTLLVSRDNPDGTIDSGALEGMVVDVLGD